MKSLLWCFIKTYCHVAIDSNISSRRHYAKHFRRLSKIILLAKQLLYWRRPPYFKSTNVTRLHQLD